MTPAEYIAAAREAAQKRYLQEQSYDPNWSQNHTTRGPYW